MGSQLFSPSLAESAQCSTHGGVVDRGCGNGRPRFCLTTRGSWALASSVSSARRIGVASRARPGGVNTRRASRRHAGQCAARPASAIGRDSSNGPQSPQLKTYTGHGRPQLVIAAAPWSAICGPSLFGLMSKSKISVGRYSEQQAFGMSTTPDTRPSIGADPSSR